MSTFSLPEACHVSLGNADFDFPAGTVVASSFEEEIALNHAVSSIQGAERTEYSVIEVQQAAPIDSDPVDDKVPEGLLTPEEISERAGEGQDEGTAS